MWTFNLLYLCNVQKENRNSNLWFKFEAKTIRGIGQTTLDAPLSVCSQYIHTF